MAQNNPVAPPSDPRVSAPAYRGLLSEREIDSWRAEFPILERVVHLGGCSQGPQSKSVRAALERYLDGWNETGMDWEDWCEETERAKAEFARLIGASPDEIAVGSSVSELVSAVAGALSYDGPRNRVLVTDAEFPTVNYVWLANERRGAQLDFVPVDAQHRIELSAYEHAVTERTLLASVTQVYYLNGFKQDLRAIADIVHSRGALLLADVYQNLGTEPINVKELGVDMLASGCLKYLFGVPGIAFLYVDRRLTERLRPTVTGWFGQENPFLFEPRRSDWSRTAARLQTGTPPVLNSYAARAGLELINRVGPERIKDRIDMLSAHALSGCLKRGLPTLSPLDVARKGATTAVLCGELDSHTMEVRLRARGIIASGRGPVIRLAPHFYTRPAELDVALDAIVALQNERGEQYI